MHRRSIFAHGSNYHQISTEIQFCSGSESQRSEGESSVFTVNSINQQTNSSRALLDDQNPTEDLQNVNDRFHHCKDSNRELTVNFGEIRGQIELRALIQGLEQISHTWNHKKGRKRGNNIERLSSIVQRLRLCLSEKRQPSLQQAIELQQVFQSLGITDLSQYTPSEEEVEVSIGPGTD